MNLHGKLNVTTRLVALMQLAKQRFHHPNYELSRAYILLNESNEESCLSRQYFPSVFEELHYASCPAYVGTEIDVIRKWQQSRIISEIEKICC